MGDEFKWIIDASLWPVYLEVNGSVQFNNYSYSVLILS